MLFCPCQKFVIFGCDAFYRLILLLEHGLFFHKNIVFLGNNAVLFSNDAVFLSDSEFLLRLYLFQV